MPCSKKPSCEDRERRNRRRDRNDNKAHLGISAASEYSFYCQKIVYLCGAGASMSLGDHGLGWGNWILAGKKYLLLPEQYELDRRIGICVNIAPRATRGNSNGMYK